MFQSGSYLYFVAHWYTAYQCIVTSRNKWISLSFIIFLFRHHLRQDTIDSYLQPSLYPSHYSQISLDSSQSVYQFITPYRLYSSCRKGGSHIVFLHFIGFHQEANFSQAASHLYFEPKLNFPISIHTRLAATC